MEMFGWSIAKMSGKVKVDGTWRDSTAPYVKVGGNWKIAKSAWTKVSDKWKSWFLQGGLNDSTFTEFDFWSGLNNTLAAISTQSDGKIILGGAFTTFNATTVKSIVRLNTDGTLDTAFTNNTGTGADGTVLSISIQSDQKIVIGGTFSTFNGTPVKRIARLNTDGTLDTAFTTNTGTSANNPVQSIAIQSDGKLVIGGAFTSFNGTTANRIARLNTDGTLDTAFTTNTGTGANNSIFSIAIQSDGKIVAGGDFSAFNGTTVNRIVRLNTDGTLDTAFTNNIGTGAGNTVFSIAIQSDQKIVVGGSFNTFNGTTVNRIARLNTDGTLDTAFTTNTGTGANNTVNAIAIQSDQKIILGGEPTIFNGTTVNRIVRLNSDGTLDPALPTVTGANNTVQSIAIQSDGKLVIGGNFTSFNGTAVTRIARLNTDGTLDTAFTTNTGTGANGVVNSIAIQSDGKIIFSGFFSTFNGTTASRVARLNTDGTLDTAFTTNIGETGTSGPVNSIAIQSDGKIVAGGAFSTFNGITVNNIVRLNTDGTRDTAFTTNTGTGANSTVNAIAIQSDGKLVIGGGFTTFNGTTVNRIVRLNTDGTLDTAFTTNTGTGANSTVLSIAIQSDGKLVIGGAFTTFNGTTVNRIARLNSDGTLDTAFTTNAGTGANGTVNAIAIQSDGKLVIGGQFATFNGTTVNRIVRLNTDGTRDTAFTTNTGTGAASTVTSIAIQLDGKIVIGGAFFEFNQIVRTRLARIGGSVAA
jgi:uncharacterized delta-60 repeat protein